MSWGLGDGERPWGGGCSLGPKQKFLVALSHSELGLALGKGTAPTRGLTGAVSLLFSHPWMNRQFPHSDET